MNSKLWIAVVLLAVAILVHALVPRYSYVMNNGRIVRHDHWTGELVGGGSDGHGRWVPLEEARAIKAKAQEDAELMKQFDAGVAAAK